MAGVGDAEQGVDAAEHPFVDPFAPAPRAAADADVDVERGVDAAEHPFMDPFAPAPRPPTPSADVDVQRGSPAAKPDVASLISDVEQVPASVLFIPAGPADFDDERDEGAHPMADFPAGEAAPVADVVDAPPADAADRLREIAARGDAHEDVERGVAAPRPPPPDAGGQPPRDALVELGHEGPEDAGEGEEPQPKESTALKLSRLFGPRVQPDDEDLSEITADGVNAVDAKPEPKAIDCRRLLWRMRFEQRLQWATCKLLAVVTIIACLLGGLYELQPNRDLSLVHKRLRTRFQLEYAEAAVSLEQVYSYAAHFSQRSDELRATSGRFWCEGRYFTTTWDSTLGAPVRTCASPRQAAVGYQNRPSWGSYHSSEAPNVTCGDNEAMLYVFLGVNATCRDNAASFCSQIELAQYCKGTCGYCTPFEYEKVAEFTERQLTVAPAVIFQTRHASKACDGFADEFNSVARVRRAPSTPAYSTTGPGVMTCPDPSSEDSEACSPGDTCAGYSAKESDVSSLGAHAKLQQMIGQAEKFDNKNVFPELLSKPNAMDVYWLRNNAWVDSLTDSVTMATLVFTEDLNVYTYLAVKFYFDAAGSVRGESEVRSYRELTSYATFYARITCAIAISAILFAIELYRLAKDQDEFVLDNSKLRANSPGLRPSIHPKDPQQRMSETVIRWGQSFEGSDLKNGWIQVKDGYLPCQVDDKKVVFQMKDLDHGMVSELLEKWQEVIVAGVLLLFMAAVLVTWGSQQWMRDQFSTLLQAVIEARGDAPRDRLITAEVATAFFKAATEVISICRWQASIRAASYFALILAGRQALCFISVHPRARLVKDLVWECGVEVMHAFFVCVVLFILTAAVAHLAFGAYTQAYSTYRDAFTTQLKWLFGQILVDPLVVVKLHGIRLTLYKMYATIFLAIYCWAVPFILLAILLQAFGALRFWAWFAGRHEQRGQPRVVGGQKNQKDVEDFRLDAETCCAREWWVDIFDCMFRLPVYMGIRTHIRITSLLAGPGGMGPRARDELTFDPAGPGSKAPPRGNCSFRWLKEYLHGEIPEQWNMAEFLKIYNDKCSGSLRHHKHELEQALTGVRPPKDGAPTMMADEVPPFADIPSLDLDTQAALHERIFNIVERWLDWAEYNCQSWEELVTTMACSVVQETLLTILESPGMEEPQLEVEAIGAGSTPFLKKILPVPYGVLGNMYSSRAKRVADNGPEPDSTVAIVDPAGLQFIQNGPRGADGAAGAIYKWLGIYQWSSFPDEVRNAIQQPLKAKLYKYGVEAPYDPQVHESTRDAVLIHAVGPDLRQQEYRGQRDLAVARLASLYKNVLIEFVSAEMSRLRLLPVSAGIFSGEFKDELPLMTVEALSMAFQQLDFGSRQRIMTTEAIEMCIFVEDEYHLYAKAFKSGILSPPGEHIQAKHATMGLVIQDGMGHSVPESVAPGLHRQLQMLTEDQELASQASSESC